MVLKSLKALNQWANWPISVGMHTFLLSLGFAAMSLGAPTQPSSTDLAVVPPHVHARHDGAADPAPALSKPSTMALSSCVSFTLANRGLKSIPLRIPGVMNPNLSPMSNSGVCLEVGQKVYFRKAGKDIVLLEVTAELQDSVLVVNKLLPKKQR
jgi:hypothetical protein